MEVLWLGIGFIVGIFICGLIRLFRRASGTLRIDQSNPEKDIYRIDIDDLDNLAKKKRIILKVDPNADLSQ